MTDYGKAQTNVPLSPLWKYDTVHNNALNYLIVDHVKSKLLSKKMQQFDLKNVFFIGNFLNLNAMTN